MWLEAIVTEQDFATLVGDLLPLTLHLGDAASDHYLRLSGPAEVSLVEDLGLRITCSAEVHWPVLGMEIPIHVQPFTVLVTPSIPEGGDALLVSPRIENADVAWVPAILDARIVDAINVALLGKSAELSWQFTKTLSHRFPLPPLAQPLRGIDLVVAWGKIRTTKEAMVLAVSFVAKGVQQDDLRAELPAPARPPEANGSARALATRAVGGIAPASTVAVGAALGLFTFFALRGAYHLLSRAPRRWQALS